MGQLVDILKGIIPPPPPPDPVEVAVDQFAAYYQQQYGVTVYPVQQEDGTVHLIDGDGRTVAIVYPDGAIEEIPQEQSEGTDPSAQVCEEPHQSFAQAECDPESQSCPLYADDGTQTQNLSKAFADASPVETATPLAAREQPPSEPAKVAQGGVVVPEEPGVADVDEPAMIAAEVPAADPPASPEASAAGVMELASSAPPPPAPSADSGLSLAAQPMSAQLFVGPDAVDGGPAVFEATVRGGTGVVASELNVSASCDAAGEGVAPGRRAEQASDGANVLAVAAGVVGECTPNADGVDGQRMMTTAGEEFAAVERRLEIGGNRSPELVSARAAISRDACAAASPAFDGQRVPQGIVALGGAAFSIETDPAAIAAANGGQGGQPHLPTISARIANGHTREELRLPDRVASADPRRDSGERHGNGGGRDGHDGREDSWELFAFDEGDDDFAPSDLRPS